MDFKNLVYGLVVFGLLLAGCTQPSAPLASPTALPSVAASPSPSVTVAAASPSAAASASPTARIPYIASAKPTTLPSAKPVSTAAPAGVPTLAKFAAEFNVAVNAAFNDSRKAYESAENVWVVDDTQAAYQYTIFIRPSKGNAFGAFDTVRTVVGANGTEKRVSLTEGETGPYYKYALTMKCFNARYDVELTLLDYTHINGSAQYRRTLGPSVMLTLADACPN
ncbi:hypothetical protein HYV43_06165 [Candidatus Micrarchaeota archaeon]|nr:hypothetical protein [Candidatus Micrarchaeota archaeon]